MKDNLKIVLRYIKSYKVRFLVIVVSIIFVILFVVGIGIFLRSV